MKYRLISLPIILLSHIPLRIMYVISDCIFYLLYYVIRYRREITRKNLVGSFPEKSEKEIKQIEKKFYRFFTDNIVESCRMISISKEEISRRIKFTNIDTINDILRSGKSISLYIGHYGNWEWVSSMPLHIDKCAVATQIYQKLRNKNMSRLIMYSRERMGAKSVEMRKTARYVHETISNNIVSIVGYIADQSPRKKDVSHFIPFLNRQAPVLVGTEKITKHYKLEAWFLKVSRVRRGYYEAEFIQLHENPSELPDFKLTEMYYNKLEQIIKEVPELYLWTHNRFKHAIELDKPLSE